MWRMQQGRVIVTEIKIHLSDCQENLGWSFEMSEKIKHKLRIFCPLLFYMHFKTCTMHTVCYISNRFSQLPHTYMPNQEGVSKYSK